MDNTGWALTIGAVAAGVYVVHKKSQPRILTPEELEMIAPAPYSTEGDDSLTPEDFSGYLSGAIGLEVEPVTPRPETAFPGLWQPSYAVEAQAVPDWTAPLPPWNWTAPLPPWNTPENPAGELEEKAPQLAKGPVQMRLGTANIQNYGPDLTPAKVAADARKMGTLCGIWGGQEITPGEDSRVVLAALGEGWDSVFTNRETPIFFRSPYWRAYDPVDRYLDRKGMKKVNPFSAITSAAFESRRFEHRPFAVVNCHLMVGGFNIGSNNPQRKEVWREEFQLFRDVIAYHHGKGRTVFGLGDFNHPACPVPFAEFRWISSTRIDRIGILPHKKGAKITRHLGNPKGEIHALNSDHSARVINVKIK